MSSASRPAAAMATSVLSRRARYSSRLKCKAIGVILRLFRLTFLHTEMDIKMYTKYQGEPMRVIGIIALMGALAITAAPSAMADDAARLGRVDFPVSCGQDTQASFNHAVATLHS